MTNDRIRVLAFIYNFTFKLGQKQAQLRGAMETVKKMFQMCQKYILCEQRFPLQLGVALVVLKVLIEYTSVCSGATCHCS